MTAGRCKRISGRRRGIGLQRPAAAAALLSGVLLLSACTPAAGRASGEGSVESVRLILDWYPNADHAGLYTAVSEGYFEREGIRLEIRIPADPSSALRQVAAGQAELAVSYETDILLARSQDLPVVSVMELVQHPLNSIITLEGSGIESPADLAGRRIGTPGTAASEAMLKTILEQASVPKEQVEAVNVGYDLVPNLLSGRLDAVIGAYWNVEGVEAELRGFTPRILRLEEWGVPNHAELVVAASEQFIEERPELARRFLKALVQGQEEAIRRPEKAAAAVLTANPDTDPELVRRGVELLVPYLADEEGRVGVHDLNEWQEYAAWMESSGLFEEGTAPDVRAAAVNDLLPAANP